METKTEENQYIIDKAIIRYNSYSKKTKSMLNIALIGIAAIFIIGVFNLGETVGAFVYHLFN